ncbi:MAG: MBL fold metallo-hydrolase [Myxococcota bacterium]|nr:MBL fold metallo-hydrolase [Myxococcota bacterium]
MRVEYVCHACLLIDTGELTVATDPWFDGPAYHDQWHVFPRPVRPEAPGEADVIVISHGHEDHLHAPTLKGLGNKDARLYHPYYWHAGAIDYFRDLGFMAAREVRSGRSIDLGDGTRLTFVVNGQDSVIVLEKDGFVIVNVNDALHSAEPEVIDLYTAHLRRRWPSIDVVFCGFGGASYYPNVFHLPGKDDRAVGIVREQLFAHNFCRIIQGLQPRLAMPFAADFCLLDESQRWINEIRFPRTRLAAYYREHFGGEGDEPRIEVMYPGDRLEGLELHKDSPLRAEMREDSLDHLVDLQYREEIAARRDRPQLSAGECEAIAREVESSLRRRASDFPSEQLASLRYTIRLRDPAETPCFHISFEDGEPCVVPAADPDPEGALVLETTSGRLGESVGSTWGGDVFIIGYGCDVHLDDAGRVRDGTANICVELLVHHLDPGREARKTPLRMLRYLASTWFASKDKILRRIRGREPVGAVGAGGDIKGEFWLLEDAASIRRRCGLPDLDDS